MPPGTANYKRLYRRVGSALNALDMSTYMNADPTINDRRRVKGVIRDAIVAADVFVQKLICVSEESPHRARFMDYSGELQHGDEVPDHYGAIGEVLVKKHSSGQFEEAIEADTIEQILQWRENVNQVFGSLAHDAVGSPLAGYFKLQKKRQGTRIRFTGYRAKIEIANIVVPAEDADPPTLYSPDAFEDVIFAHATSESYKEGDDITELAKFRSYVEKSAPLILAGATEIPPFQQK